MKAPTEEDYDDERFIDAGASKMVWRLDEFAVINAYDSQRFHGLDKYTEDQKIEISNRTISMEYNFTLYLNGIFPALIPRVYLFKDPYPFEDNRFRYVKDFCPPVENDEGLFDKLIKVSDTLLDKGWVYLDIKPENLSEKNGQLSIVDTDYKSLYKVPEDMIPDFRKWVYMIVLIYTYNYITIIDPKTLIEFIKKKGIDSKMLRELRPKFSGESWDKISNKIIEYGNKFFRGENVDDYIQLNYIMDPYAFFEAYGAKKNETPSVRFLKLMDLANAETTADAKAETTAKAPAEAPAEAKAETTAEAPAQAPAEVKAKAPAQATAQEKAKRPMIGSRPGIGAGAQGEAKKGPIQADRTKYTPRGGIPLPKAKPEKKDETPEDNVVLQPNPIAEPKGKSPERTLLKSDDSQKTNDSESDEESVVENKQNAVLTKKIKGVGNQKTKKGKGNPTPTPKDRRRKVPVKLNESK